MRLLSILPLITLPLSLAKTISIDVGEGGLVFEPESVTADVGDLLQFHFYPKNHSVAEGSFSSPCQPLAGGVYSGFMPEETGEGTTIFQVTVNSTDAIYFYCSQVEHCQHGMAMVVNPSSSGALAAYKAAAINASTVSPSVIAGGVFISATGNSTSTSGSNSTTPSTSTPTPSVASFEGGAADSRFSQCGLLSLVGVSALLFAMI